MAKSLRRQKILFKRTLQRLAANGTYVQDEQNPEDYVLKTLIKTLDSKYPKVIIDHNRFNVATGKKLLARFF